MFSTQREWSLYLEDILQECKNIKIFTHNISYEEFTHNLEKVYAVAKAFENIGEAVKQLPSEILADYSHIPWSEIAKMRDILTHHYFGVDDKILWNTLNEDFKEFCIVIEDMIQKAKIEKLKRVSIAQKQDPIE